MTARTLNRYVHHRGVHCATTALRNVYAYYTGEALSEGLVFGLGAGLNFTYAQFPDSAVWLTMGRGSYLEMNFCEVLGIDLSTYVFRDKGPAIEAVCEAIDQERPVIADTDMFLLPYMKSALHLPERVNFGGHKVVISGYDATRNVAQVHDYAWSECQELTYDVLALARTSPGSPSSPMNRIYLLEVPAYREEMCQAIRSAILKAVHLMEYPPMHYLGLAALDRFCRQLPNWARLLRENAALNVRVASFMMESAGTGGGNYRKLYARFLLESAETCGAGKLEQAAAIYFDAARLWTELSLRMREVLQRSSEAELSGLSECASLTNEIWLVERRGVECLKAYAA